MQIREATIYATRRPNKDSSDKYAFASEEDEAKVELRLPKTLLHAFFGLEANPELDDDVELRIEISPNSSRA